MQFGPKPLFENISVKFGDGNRATRSMRTRTQLTTTT